ncbi:MAG: XRE family transcriptional regulator [Lachnospiraceae bacterium]|nr:XRE family transcriptional regulator [Lachnospiraceae bacterium]
MYITQNIAKRIKSQLKYKKINTKTMLADLNMGINAISEFAKGKEMSCISLAKIADYLDCSTDYLLGRTDNPEINRNEKGIDILK